MNSRIIIALVVASILSCACGVEAPKSQEELTVAKIIDRANVQPRAALARGVQEQLEAQMETLLAAEAHSMAKDAIGKYEVNPELNGLRLNNTDPKILSWQEVFAIGLARLNNDDNQIYTEQELLEDMSFKSFEETDRARQLVRDKQIRMLVSYGLVQSGADWRGLKTSVTLLFEDEVSRELAYKLALPSIKTAFGLMSQDTKSKYLTALRHAEKYMNTFDLVEESDYLESLKEDGELSCRRSEWPKAYYKPPAWFMEWGGLECENLFTRFGIDGKVNPYRKLEAFIFRRVTEKANLGVMKAFVARLIADVSPSS